MHFIDACMASRDKSCYRIHKDHRGRVETWRKHLDGTAYTVYELGKPIEIDSYRHEGLNDWKPNIPK